MILSKNLSEPYFLSCLLLLSTKKVSSLKKILITLSIAVVVVISWILADLNVVNNY